MKRWSLDARSEGQSGDSPGKTGRSLIKGKDIGDARRWDYSIHPQESAILLGMWISAGGCSRLAATDCGTGLICCQGSPQQSF